MKIVALVVGHSTKSQGAVDPISGITEFQVNAYVAYLVILNNNNPNIKYKIIYRSTTYLNLPSEIDTQNPDFVLPLHLNAYNEEARGSEVLSSGSDKSLRLAKILQKKVAALTGVDRGVKIRTTGQRGGFILQKVKAPCALAEPLFIDNNIDLENDKQFLDDYSMAIIESFNEYFD